ncbi:MAG: ABC transporter ATP-binding protein [Candidatus Krumholzibacteriota bacterium]|nr:ABC transporter ATP-binding protein [Candidatus Krumholzibacteriota bacterium]
MSIELNNFSVTYGEVKAVDNLSTVFPPGSTGLLGPNGAGKSSLIKGLLGLVPDYSGGARILGRDINSERKQIRQMIGYMPEDDCLIPGLSGVGMVQYAGELSGMSAADAMQRAHEVLLLVGLGEARYRKVETYSSGMKQRIKLAQAIVHDPRLLFLDEPTSGMDPQGRMEILQLISMIPGRSEVSIILATHILVDVERTCDRVAIMNRGKLLKEGSVEGIKGKYAETYSVRVEGNRALFQEELRKNGCQVAADGKHLLDVTLPPGADTGLVVRTAGETGVQLRRLVPGVQSLEDAFIKLIGVDEHADL